MTDPDVAIDERLAGRLFVGVLVLWLLVPIALHDYAATDTTPFVVAGRFVRSGDTADIYLDSNSEVTPRFRAEACPDADPGCQSAPYVAPPQALPLALPLGYLSIRWAAFVIRTLDALALVLTMWLLWRRLATSAQRRLVVAVTAALLTPLVVVTLDMGNNTPLIVLLVAISLDQVHRPTAEAALGIGIAVATVLKLFPAALLVVALVHRRLRVAAWCLVGVLGLTLAAAFISPASMYGEFWRTSSRWSEKVSVGWFNASIEASARAYFGDGWRVVVWALRVAIVVAVLRLYRRVPTSAWWPLAPLLVIAVFPQGWVYYLFFAVLAVCALAESSGRLWLIPIAAAVASVPAIAQRLEVHTAWPYTSSLVASLVVVALALPLPERTPATRT